MLDAFQQSADLDNTVRPDRDDNVDEYIPQILSDVTSAVLRVE